MAYSNRFSYLKPGNKSSASGSVTNPDKDGFYKVEGNPKTPKIVGQNKKEINQEIWQIVDDDDDDVKVPIKGKLQKPKSESSHSNIILVDSKPTDEHSDGFYMIDDLGDEESMLKKMENLEKQTYAIIKAKGNNARVIQTDDPNAWEASDSSDDSFEVVGSNQKVDDELSSIIANLNTNDIDNAQLPLHLQPFYEPDQPKKPLIFYPQNYDSDSGSSIEVLESWD